MGNSEILDPNFTKFKIKWDGSGSPLDIDAEIQNQNGEKSGRIKSSGFINKKISLSDVSNSIILTAYKKHAGFGGNYEVKDVENNTIGTVHQKTISWKKRMHMKNSNNVKILKIECEDRWFSKGVIKTKDDKMVAHFVKKTDKEKKSFWNSIYHNTCLLIIDEPQYDRKNIFALFISFLNSFYDYSPSDG